MYKPIMVYLVISLLLRHVLAQNHHQFQITFIQDDSVDYSYPTESMDIYVRIITENLKSECKNSVSINSITVNPKTDFSRELIRYKDEGNRMNSFIILGGCQTAEVLIHHLSNLLKNPNVIFLDYSICQSLKVLTNIFHLEVFRLNRKTLPTCVQGALHNWVQDTVCSAGLDQKTKYLLHLANSTDIFLDECNMDPDLNLNSHLTLLTSEAEENYIRYFIRGKQLRAATFEETDIVTFDRSPLDNSVIRCYGFNCYLFNILQQQFDFTYSIASPEDGEFGAERMNGSWTGLIGMVVEKKVDIAIRGLTLILARYQAVDFLVSIEEDPIEILSRIPEDSDGNFACLAPFTYRTWIAVLLGAVALSLSLWVYEKKTKLIHQVEHETSLIDFILFVYKVLLGQSIGRRIKRVTVLMTSLMMAWNLCAVILINAYTGNMLSHLLIKQRTSTINSLEDLLTSSLQWVIRKGTSVETVFTDKNAKQKTYGKIGDLLRLNPELMIEPNEYHEIPNLITGGKYAYISDSSSTKHIIENDYLRTNRCRMNKAKTGISDIGVSFVVRKKSPLAAILNKKIQQIQQSGLDIYWYRNEKSKVPKLDFCKASDKGEKRLTLQNLRSSFLVLGIGLILATISFVLEILFHFLYSEHQ